MVPVSMSRSKRVCLPRRRAADARISFSIALMPEGLPSYAIGLLLKYVGTSEVVLEVELSSRGCIIENGQPLPRSEARRDEVT